MKCFVCARAGDDDSAVALCPHCNAGLCLVHVGEAARDSGPGGLRLSCGHATWSRVTVAQVAEVQAGTPY
jgi:hypothetical protein